jgi:small conductance mechanosensitive channel
VLAVLHLLPAPASPSTKGAIYDFIRNQLRLSAFWAEAGQALLVRALRIGLVVVLAMVLSRVGAGVVRHTVEGLRLRVASRSSAVRAEDRAHTVSTALSSVLRAIIWVIAGLTILGEVGIKLGPFIAGATVIGAALGFGAQSLVRDFLSGFLILVEDQYGIGDVIMVGDTTGTVESLNLRTTRVRAFDGIVWYIPNGDIRKVANTSDDYNRAVVDVILPWRADIEHATRVIEEAAAALAADPAFHDAILEPPEVLGVDRLAAEGVTVRVAVKTRPGDRTAVARALRLRIQRALQSAGLSFNAVESAGPAPSGDVGTDSS